MKNSNRSDMNDNEIFTDVFKYSSLVTLNSKFESYEREREILLELGNDITKVREKNDLISLFSLRIKSLFYFTHATITLIDNTRQTYFPFLFDHSASPVRDHKEYGDLVSAHFTLNEPFISKVINSDVPELFHLDEIVDKPGSPRFLKLNHEKGIQEILMTPLRSKMKTIGFLHLYSDRKNSFSSGFKNIIKGIAPQISVAVANIIKNEEIDHNEMVNKVLLSLSNDMVMARNRRDLLKVTSDGLKKLIPFTQSMMTVLDKNGETYHAYFTGEDSRSNEFSKYNDAVSSAYTVNDGIYDLAVQANKPVIFKMKSFDIGKSPLWLRLNYVAGAREMMINVLPDEGIGKHSLILFADKEDTFDKKSLDIISRISSQLSTAACNISVNEEILRKEKEKLFLLDFSQDIASVRTKEELQNAIINVLLTVLDTKIFMIRIVEDDGVSLSLYMAGKNMQIDHEPVYREFASKNITTNEYLTARVLKSQDPVIFNIEEENRKGKDVRNFYLWKKANLKNAYGTALRVGNQTVGILWLLADEVNLTLLAGLSAQISIAISNIRAGEKVLNFKQKLEVENDLLKEQITAANNFSEIIGNGVEMQKVYNLISQVAPSRSTVLLLGETGTGKELIARAVHNASPRKNKSLIKINCAALPANLIESELFGHEKGAFTGAIDRRMGKFELANNSTLFLDEIGEMPLEAQVKLLRVLQEKELERVGGKTTIQVDVRIIAATNRNLEEEVKAGRFRSDLFYRINVFPISLPPLRDRPEDISPLANFFVSKYGKNAGKKIESISPNVMQDLKKYPWPGNVRELEHLIERNVLLTNERTLHEIHLPKIKSETKNEPKECDSRTLEEVERSYILEIIRRCGGKLSGQGGASEFLNVPATTLHSKIRKLGIQKTEWFKKP